MAHRFDTLYPGLAEIRSRPLRRAALVAAWVGWLPFVLVVAVLAILRPGWRVIWECLRLAGGAGDEPAKASGMNIGTRIPRFSGRGRR